MRGVLGMMYKDILEFHQQALRVFGKPSESSRLVNTYSDLVQHGNRYSALFGKISNARFKHLISNLQRHKTLIKSLANVLEIKASHEARDLAEKAFQDADKARKDNQRVAVRTWLSARNVQLDHDVYTEVRKLYPSTGLWVLQKTAIAAWLDNQHTSGCFVWINGIPGAGKPQISN
jgi:hypothetical protein